MTKEQENKLVDECDGLKYHILQSLERSQKIIKLMNEYKVRSATYNTMYYLSQKLNDLLKDCPKGRDCWKE